MPSFSRPMFAFDLFGCIFINNFDMCQFSHIVFDRMSIFIVFETTNYMYILTVLSSWLLNFRKKKKKSGESESRKYWVDGVWNLKHAGSGTEGHWFNELNLLIKLRQWWNVLMYRISCFLFASNRKHIVSLILPIIDYAFFICHQLYVDT